MGNILKSTVILSSIIGALVGLLVLIPPSQVLMIVLLVISIISGMIAYFNKNITARNIAATSGVLLLSILLKPLILISFFVLIGAGTIVYLKKNNLVGILSIQDGALIGAVSGFSSLIAASFIYIPGNSIISMFLGHHLIKFSFVTASYDFILAFVLPFFIALILSAPFNAFTGMIAAYIYEKIEDRPFEFPTNFEITQDE